MALEIVAQLRSRGFLYQTTHQEELEAHLRQPRTFYVGFDPTADSLHVGNLVPIMAMAHLQRAGHRPIAIVGGGTARVGDPSGKTEMRQMLSEAQILANQQGLQRQLERFLVLDGKAGFLLNNDAWLLPLGYIEFLREVGCHFSVNRMLTADSVRLRLESGLSFIEFNYMLLQAYDFFILMRDHGCTLQLGGQDQWGNIVAGIDLCRRMGLETQGFGMTFPLILNASGTKFGKSQQGNIWLSPEKTRPFEYYQFWRNCDDQDLERLLRLFTFLPCEEIERLAGTGGNINRAKEILAFEATALNHGFNEAASVYALACQQFGCADPKGEVVTSSTITQAGTLEEQGGPELTLTSQEVGTLTWAQLLVRAALAGSGGEARRLIQGGGARFGGQLLNDPHARPAREELSGADCVLRAGKKRFCRLRLLD